MQQILPLSHQSRPLLTPSSHDLEKSPSHSPISEAKVSSRPSSPIVTAIRPSPAPFHVTMEKSSPPLSSQASGDSQTTRDALGATHMADPMHPPFSSHQSSHDSSARASSVQQKAHSVTSTPTPPPPNQLAQPMVETGSSRDSSAGAPTVRQKAKSLTSTPTPPPPNQLARPMVETASRGNVRDLIHTLSNVTTCDTTYTTSSPHPNAAISSPPPHRSPSHASRPEKNVNEENIPSSASLNRTHMLAARRSPHSKDDDASHPSPTVTASAILSSANLNTPMVRSSESKLTEEKSTHGCDVTRLSPLSSCGTVKDMESSPQRTRYNRPSKRVGKKTAAVRPPPREKSRRKKVVKEDSGVFDVGRRDDGTRPGSSSRKRTWDEFMDGEHVVAGDKRRGYIKKSKYVFHSPGIHAIDEDFPENG